MNKRTIMASLNKIANALDNGGLHNEADTVTKVMSRLAYDDNPMQYGTESLEEDLYSPDGYDGEMDYDGDDDDFDMGPEKEPFDYSSPVDKGDMYGDDMNGYMDEDTDF